MAVTTHRPGVPVLVALGAGFFAVLADTTASNVALPAIGRHFGAPIEVLQWTLTAYTVAFAGLLLAGGVLGDRFGPRRLYILGAGLFAVGAAACAFAPGFGWLVAARVLQGVGAAMLLPNSLAILSSAFTDPRARTGAIAVWSGIGAMAIMLGPVVGGFLVEWVGWQAVFAFTGLTSLAAVGLTLVTVERSTPAAERSIDGAGLTVGALALGAFVFTIAQSGIWGWRDGRVYLGLAVAIVSAIAFVLIEQRVKRPAVPLQLFNRAGFAAPVAIGFLFNFAFYGMPFVLSFYLQTGLGVSSGTVGLLFLPMALADAAISFSAGRIAAAIGAGRAIVGGLGIATLGAGLAAMLVGGPAVVAGYLVVGAGSAMVMPPLTSLLLEDVPARQSGTAAGILNASRQAGGATGIAVLGLLMAMSDLPTATVLAMALIAAAFGATVFIGVRYIGLAPAAASSR